MTLTIEIRDSRLRGGRLLISARTPKRTEQKRRETAVRWLLDRGEGELIERLRKRDLRIEDVARAHADGTVDKLRKFNASPLDLGSVLDRTMTTVAATLEHGSWMAYMTLQKQLIAWQGRNYDIRNLTSAEAETWLYEPKATNDGQPWSTARQILMRTLAGRIWNDAIARERDTAEVNGARPRITRNPWKAVVTRGVARKRAAYLQPEQWRRLAEVSKGTPGALVFALGALAGLRRGEIAHLRTWVDFDRTKRVIHVQPRDGQYRWRPKGKRRSVRTLDVSDELLAIHDEHVALGFAGERYLVHPARFDRPPDGNTLRAWAVEAFKAAGLKYGMRGEGLTIHSLRHTFASWLVQDGVSPMVVAQLLGDTVQMVIEVYSHLAPRNFREAMDAVGRISRKGFAK